MPAKVKIMDPAKLPAVVWDERKISRQLKQRLRRIRACKKPLQVLAPILNGDWRLLITS